MPNKGLFGKINIIKAPHEKHVVLFILGGFYRQLK